MKASETHLVNQRRISVLSAVQKASLNDVIRYLRRCVKASIIRSIEKEDTDEGGLWT